MSIGPEFLDDDDFKASIALDYGRQLYEYSRNIREPHFLEFRTLQRINISELQNSLARQNSEIAKAQSASETQLKELRLTLEAYSTYNLFLQGLTALTDNLSNGNQELRIYPISRSTA